MKINFECLLINAIFKYPSKTKNRLRKLIAILLLNIYLLCLCGQLAVYQYLSYRADTFYNVQTKEGRYNINDLTEVKIPADMHSISEWAAYEDVCGRVQFAAGSYNYVKMRITRDAIYLMCVPNYETTRLSTQNVIHAENINDIQIPKKDHVPYGKSTVSYNLSFAFIKFEFNAPFKSLAKKAIQPVLKLTCHNPDIPEQPPKLTC